MIILTSNGLSSCKLINEAKKQINTGKAALVVTADNVYKEKNYYVERLTKELNALGLSVDCFDFDVQSPFELMQYDVVELIGGNPYYLLNSIQKHGFLDALAHFAQNRLLIGCSAGALVLAPSLDLIDVYTPEMNIVGLTDLSACNLTDIQILPHYSKFLKKYDAFEEKCAKYEQAHNCKIIRLNDGEGVITDNSSITIVN